MSLTWPGCRNHRPSDRYRRAYADPETGYQYLTNRYYDPGTAQFLTVDPLVAETGSAYGYVGGNPLNGADPSGLLSIFGHRIGFHPGAGLNAIVNIGRGASFGLSDKIANWIEPGASCTIAQNSTDQFLGSAAVIVAAGGAGAPEAEGGADTVFSGHGAYVEGSGEVTVPDGTSVSTYAPHDSTITDEMDNQIETGNPPTPIRVYGTGETMPNYTLYPPDGLNIAGNPVTVTEPTPLSELLQENMGSCHWAACTEVIPSP